MTAALLAALLAAAPAGMARIPARTYVPFLEDRAPGARDGGREVVPVAAFLLDVRPVTVGEYLAFVTAQPRWRRSQAPRLFAEARYLARWRGDLEPGLAADAPVTLVSWFSARAYCAWKGKRLPTVAEWEVALTDDGRGKAEVSRRILDWYQAPAQRHAARVGQTPKNGFGVQDLAGLVWEWTEDFNARMTSNDGRARDSKGLFCGSAGAAAADPSDSATFLREGLRGSLEAAYTLEDLGFRCAKDVTP